MSLGHRDRFGRPDRGTQAERAHHAAQGVVQPRDARDVRHWREVYERELARLAALLAQHAGAEKR